MRAVFVMLATAAIALVAGYAIVQMRIARRGWVLALAMLAPLLIYAAFFLASPKPEEGSTFGWFLTGLVFVSPILVPWMACLPAGYRMGSKAARQSAAKTDDDSPGT